MTDEPKRQDEDVHEIPVYTIEIPEDMSLNDIVNALDRSNINMQLTAEGVFRLMRENEGGQHHE